MNDKDKQGFSAKKGEVTFRQKLASQQSKGGRIVFPDVHNYNEMIETMRQRAATTRQAMRRLLADGIQLSPFIELGAERCQRALVLANEFDAQGIAIDISFDMLRLGEEVAKGLGYDKVPMRICCDANNLPVRDSVLSFAFCYETLHHFPDPSPIIKELARVLGDQSILYFDEEPVKGSIYRFTRLYQRHGHRLSPFENILNRLGILPLISKAGGIEIEHGVLEEEFDLTTWQRALDPFQNTEVIVNKRLGLHLDNFRFGLSKVLAGMMGGNIEVRCMNAKSQPASTPSNSLIEMLKCPTCAPKHPVPLLVAQQRQGLQCDECGCFYPEIDGVLFLLEISLGRSLYPEYFL